jgi:hypothetical protein
MQVERLFLQQRKRTPTQWHKEAPDDVEYSRHVDDDQLLQRLWIQQMYHSVDLVESVHRTFALHKTMVSPVPATFG